jgi:hypothetical protein
VRRTVHGFAAADGRAAEAAAAGRWAATDAGVSHTAATGDPQDTHERNKSIGHMNLSVDVLIGLTASAPAHK